MWSMWRYIASDHTNSNGVARDGPSNNATGTLRDFNSVSPATMATGSHSHLKIVPGRSADTGRPTGTAAGASGDWAEGVLQL